MKAWTLYEPWASLVILGEKEWETRSRPNRKIVDVRLAIHAAKKPVTEQLDEDGCFKDDFMLSAFAKYDIDPDMFALGSVIGFATVTSCQPVEEVRDTLNPKQIAFGDWSDGRWCFRLQNPQMIEPVPARGYQCIWNWDMEGYYPGYSPLTGLLVLPPES